MTNQELIKKGSSVIYTKKVGENTIGNVGSALISDSGRVYQGVCIDTGSNIGFCAERNAIGSMVTAGEYKINKIVAIWKDDEGNDHIVSPCGVCREFMRQVDEANLDTEVILETDKVVKLRDLLPYDHQYRKI